MLCYARVSAFGKTQFCESTVIRLLFDSYSWTSLTTMTPSFIKLMHDFALAEDDDQYADPRHTHLQAFPRWRVRALSGRDQRGDTPHCCQGVYVGPTSVLTATCCRNFETWNHMVIV